MNKEENIEQFITFFHCIIYKYTDNYINTEVCDRYINTEVRYMKMCIYMEKPLPIPYK